MGQKYSIRVTIIFYHICSALSIILGILKTLLSAVGIKIVRWATCFRAGRPSYYFLVFVSVKLIEIIELSCLAAEDVNDDGGVIEDYPASVISALASNGLNTRKTDLIIDLVYECSDLR